MTHPCLLGFRASLFALILFRYLVAELGLPLDEHIAFCVQALREHTNALGLRGSL